MFKLGGEGKMFTKGSERVVLNLEDSKYYFKCVMTYAFLYGVEILGYDLMINVASCFIERRKMFDILLRARAIETFVMLWAATELV